jgi:hypothetical protein
MKLSEAGHTSNIEYWKTVAKRYQAQRDMALQKVQFLQERMLAETGKAYDGNDWLRQLSLPQVHVATTPFTIFYEK